MVSGNQFYRRAPGWTDEQGRHRVDPEPAGTGEDWLGDLRARLDAIEARQRDYGMHDPGCPERTEEKHLAKHFENWPTIPRPKCTCWLSKEADEGHD